MMTPRQQYILRLLQNLELSLKRGDRLEEGERVSILLRSAEQARDPESVLESASAIAAFGELPVRLLWYAERYGDIPQSAVDPKVTDYMVGKLAESLERAPVTQPVEAKPVPAEEPEEAPESPQAQEAEQPASRSALALVVENAAHDFSSAVAAVRREVFKNEQFAGLTELKVRTLIRIVGRLLDAAHAEAEPDVERFAVACTDFLEYVLQHSLFSDVRVVNFLDNASLTLHTTINTHNEDDFDSLQQTTEMLSNPEALFNGASNTKG